MKMKKYSDLGIANNKLFSTDNIISNWLGRTSNKYMDWLSEFIKALAPSCTYFLLSGITENDDYCIRYIS